MRANRFVQTLSGEGFVKLVHDWRVQFALLCGALSAIFVIFGIIVSDARQDVTRGVSIAAGNLAAAVAHDVDRNLELLDLSLQAVAKAWVDPQVKALSPALQKMVLFDRSAAAQGLGSLFVLDAGGALRASSSDNVPDGTSFSDRDYFRVHLTAADFGLFVSKPIQSRISGQWVLAISRRITNTDGSSAGVAVGTLPLAYLSKLYSGLNVGSEGSITLFRTDGRVIVRDPYVESDIRRSLGSNDGFEQIRSSRSGSFEGPSPVDGARRVVSFHRVGSLPLIQDVEVSVDHAYASWRRKTITIGAVLGLLCLCTLTLAWMLNAELKRRIKIEAVLERLAATDPLTDLANRRRFGQALDAEWRRAARDGTSLSLLMIDADRFKSFNDAYGHPAGDALIKALAGCIGNSVARPGDLAARYGGEEFAVLLPDTPLAGALAVAESIRLGVLQLGRPHAASPDRIASVSIGVATAKPASGGTSDDLVSAADDALYGAKQDGRNCCRSRSTRAKLAVA